MTDRMELLSPAGDVEKLKTAFEYGADAAYMGLKSFSLRTNARNFDYSQADEIRRIKEKYGKKLYCTCNIFFHEKDIVKLKSELEEMRHYPFDAFIISDIGILELMKSSFPDAQMHLSTQANCINASSAKLYSQMGFDRIILGRETPLEDIKKIRDANPQLGIEAFVHGAMCMAYSGRCFLSAFMSGRSANQGDCAHSCRWNYRLALEEESRPGIYYPVSEEDGFTTVMSSKDLCMIDHLRELGEAGVDSLKIEGRMKSTYYVATVTRAYRKALDNLYNPEVEYKAYRDELFNVSHREYSTGFFFGNGPVELPSDSPDAPPVKDNINIHTENGYLRDYQFLGTVGEEVRPGVWNVDVKNQIRNGESLEFIGPDVLFLKADKVYTYDEDFNPVLHIDHCNGGYIETDLPLKSGYLIRREM